MKFSIDLKNISLIILALLCFQQANAQKSNARQLTWKIGEVELTRGEQVQVSYPVMVSINEDSNAPQLGTSTMRLFYDAGQLKDLQVASVANNYQISGMKQSNDAFGDLFEFVGGGGVFVQFNLMANLQNLLALSNEPVHVFNLNFTVVPGTRIPLCAPLVLDNQTRNENGKLSDSGYLLNDGGIAGTYHLNGKTNAVFLADDEVQNYLWEHNGTFGKILDPAEAVRPGHRVRLKSKTCLELKRPALPADMDLFDAWKEGKDLARLSWNTRSEFNNDVFEVQRSGDGLNFETIGTVNGQWNSLEITDYEFFDRAPLSGINYYRLAQVDHTGRTNYTSVKEVAFELGKQVNDENWQISYYPNPSRGKVQLSSNKVFTNVDLDIYDAEGRLVMKKNNISSDGPLDLSTLSAGVYSLSVLNRDGKILDTQQLVIIAE